MIKSSSNLFKLKMDDEFGYKYCLIYEINEISALI